MAETDRTAGKRRRTTGRVVAFSAAPRRTKVAVTGGAGLLGARLVRALASRGGTDVVILDLAPAPDSPPEVRHRFLDLNLPHADGTMLKLLREEKPDVLVHLAALRSPSHDTTYAHELNSIGALHVMAAAGEAGVDRIVFGSTTLVYGARGDNPNYLTESHPLRPDAGDAFVRDFVEAEAHARDFVRRYPKAKVAILRFAQLLGPELRDYRSKWFAGPVVVSLLGYDPLIQALHPEDAVDALMLAIANPEAHGVYNVAPDGVVPLSTVYLLYGTLAIPLPHPLAYATLEATWTAGIGLMPGVHADYLRYLCIAGNEKAKKLLAFTPKHTTLETVLETARERFGSGRLVNWEALADAARRADYRFRRSVESRRPAPPAAERPSPRAERARRAS